jgi:thiol-disulfide isomerase/thioredoxin
MHARLLVSTVAVFLLLLPLSLFSAAQQSSPTATPTPTSTPAPAPAALKRLPAKVLDAKLKNARGRGRSFSLSEYSGKILVINLWATWCGPCRPETPQLVKLYKEFRGRGVVMVGLSTEDPVDSSQQVREWVRNFAIPYRIGWTTQDVAITLMNGRDAIPQTFVIGRNGRIVRRFVGFNQQKTPEQFKTAINEALEGTSSTVQRLQP